MGLDYDRARDVFEKVQTMTLDDVKAVQQQWVKDRNYYYLILGDSKNLDLNYLRTLGPITFLSQEQIFGY
jgi:predicted Zn-dependent peptidase